MLGSYRDERAIRSGNRRRVGRGGAGVGHFRCGDWKIIVPQDCRKNANRMIHRRGALRMVRIIISNKPARIDKHLLPGKVSCPLPERGIYFGSLVLSFRHDRMQTIQLWVAIRLCRRMTIQCLICMMMSMRITILLQKSNRNPFGGGVSVNMRHPPPVDETKRRCA